MTESFVELALTDVERELVATWAPLLEPEIDPLARGYLAHMKTTEIGRLLTPERIDQLLPARIAHWRMLVRGDFVALADDYAERFGRRLVDAGFPLRIFVIATDWFVVELTRFVDACHDIPEAVKSDLRIALTKYAFLDLTLAHASREVAYLD